jgi:hypothetical protein
LALAGGAEDFAVLTPEDELADGERASLLEGALAADSLIHAPRRTSGSVAALMLSMAAVVGFAGMAQAFNLPVVSHLLPEILEPRFHQGSPALPKGSPLRVAHIRDKGRGGATWDSLLLDALRFNEKSVVENGDNFLRVLIDASTPESTAID